MSFVVCDILGVPINNLNLNEATYLILLYMEKENKESKIVFTPNPEFIMEALKDKEFMQILNKSHINIADGIGIVIASKILKTPLKERVAGFDLTQSIFSKIRHTNKTVYFLGSNEETIISAKNMMEKKYKGLKIIGCKNGYFSENEEDLIIEEINKLKPNLLLVGLGCPKQEKWIFKNVNRLEANVIIGVGGSFDVMSGNVKRAPKIFIKLNLEWYYRLITQPTRFKRMLKLPLFILQVFKHKLKGGKNENKKRK